MKWALIFHTSYSENTPEYGCGDFPDSIDYIRALVEADTKRNAQNAAKRLVPNARFGGMFGDTIREVSKLQSWDLKPADRRLPAEKQQIHNQCLALI